MLKVVIAAVALCRAAQIASGSAVLKASKDVLLKAVHDYCDYQEPKPEPPQYSGKFHIGSYANLDHLKSGNHFIIPILSEHEKGLVASGQKIEAIKALRIRLGNSLIQAKVAVDFFQAANYES